MSRAMVLFALVMLVGCGGIDELDLPQETPTPDANQVEWDNANWDEQDWS